MTYTPGEITVENTSVDGCYISYKKTNSKREPIRVVFPEESEDPSHWSMGLDDSELEAAIQICYDHWNFSSGNERSYELFRAALDERGRRMLPYSTYAPGIFLDESAEIDPDVFLIGYELNRLCHE